MGKARPASIALDSDLPTFPCLHRWPREGEGLSDLAMQPLYVDHKALSPYNPARKLCLKSGSKIPKINLYAGRQMSLSVPKPL